MMQRLRLLPDVPVGEGSSFGDGLRFDQYAAILARAALDTPEPFTIGIYGGWGSGKTNLMRMIAGVVQEEGGTIPVWFNAWRYEKEEHLIIPLLATIISEMDRQESMLKGMKKGLAKLRDALRGILYGVSIKGKVGIPGLTEAELSVSPKEMIDRYEKLREMATDRILDQSLYFRSFTRLDEIAGTEGIPKLIIFVDDLDRCFPDKAVALLESIKLVLNQPNVTFVLGIAPQIIRAYLTAKYSREFSIPERLYEDYLDKLVQLPFPVPEIRETVGEYVRALLKREDVFGSIEEQSFAEQYEPLIAICGPACKDNPRAIIRFLNRLLILTHVHEMMQAAKPWPKRMAISLVHFGITNALQMKWPAVWQACDMDRLMTLNDPIERKVNFTTVLLEIFTKHEEDRTQVDALEKYADDISSPTKEVLQAIADDESLRVMLRSQPGLEWLAKPDIRREVCATAEQIKIEITPEPEEERHYALPWAEGYIHGWPVAYGVAIMPGASLHGMDFSGADLSAANLERADLRRANLQGANLKRANLRRAILQGAELDGAQLQGADLDYADLQGARLRYTSLEGTRMSSANLRRAHLQGANLKGATVNGAVYDGDTMWPDGFDPHAGGAMFI